MPCGRQALGKYCLAAGDRSLFVLTHFVSGPWNWTYMAHNNDQRPSSLTGTGRVWLTLKNTTSQIITVFEVDNWKPQSILPVVTMMNLENANLTSCRVIISSNLTQTSERWQSQSVSAICTISNHSTDLSLELEFTAEKSSTKLLTTSFL